MIHYIPVNNFSVMSGYFLGLTSTMHLGQSSRTQHSAFLQGPLNLKSNGESPVQFENGIKPLVYVRHIAHSTM